MSIKTNGYSSAKLHAKWDRKRQEGEARQREHDKLTAQDKISLAKTRRGESKREIARLMAKLVKQPEYPQVAPLKAEVVVIQGTATEKKTRVSKREVIHKAKAERPSKS
jgi:hypothetical protein